MSGPSSEWEAQAWVDLLLDEQAARSAQHRVTGRALLFQEAGLPVAKILDALKLTEPEWDDRVVAFGVWRAENRAAAATFEVRRVEP